MVSGAADHSRAFMWDHMCREHSHRRMTKRVSETSRKGSEKLKREFEEVPTGNGPVLKCQLAA